MATPRLILLLIILVGVGGILTYCSVFLPPTTTTINPGGSGSSDYGFPLPWKVNNVLYCSPLHPQACPTPIYSSDYDWIAFTGDILFYAVLGYCLLVGYSRLSGPKLAG